MTNISRVGRQARRLSGRVATRVAACALAYLCAAGAASAEEIKINGLTGDPENGKTLFGICQSCHQIGPRAKDRTGPILNNLLGRAAGARDEYHSSFPMVLAGMRGLVWTPQTLDEYLTDPQAMVPNTATPFVGVPNPQDRADLVAYLLTAGAVD